jgi:hypothetical protein
MSTRQTFPEQSTNQAYSLSQSAVEKTPPFPQFLILPPSFHAFALGTTLGKGLSSFLKTSLLLHSHTAP